MKWLQLAVTHCLMDGLLYRVPATPPVTWLEGPRHALCTLRCCVRSIHKTHVRNCDTPGNQTGNRPPLQPELARQSRVCQTPSHAAAPAKPS